MFKAAQISLLRLHGMQVLRVAIGLLLQHYLTVEPALTPRLVVSVLSIRVLRGNIGPWLNSHWSEVLVQGWCPITYSTGNKSSSSACHWRWNDFRFPYPCLVPSLKDSTGILEAGRCIWTPCYRSPNADLGIPKYLEVDSFG